MDIVVVSVIALLLLVLTGALAAYMIYFAHQNATSSTTTTTTTTPYHSTTTTTTPSTFTTSTTPFLAKAYNCQTLASQYQIVPYQTWGSLTDTAIQNWWNAASCNNTKITSSSTTTPSSTTITPSTTITTPVPSSSSGVWQQANVTLFDSYPTTAAECTDYSGCQYEGLFAFFNGKLTESQVAARNIVAIHCKDSNLANKQIRLRVPSTGATIDAEILDCCLDSDCASCCTQNASQNGLNFLIDIERYTAQRLYNQPFPDPNSFPGGIIDFQILD